MVLDALVAGQEFDAELRDPVRAVRDYSRDPELGATAETKSGKVVAALDVMELYLEVVEERNPEGQERSWVVRQWRELVDLLRRDKAAAGDRLDWVAKWNLMEDLGGVRGLDEASLRKIDFAYHLVDPGLSLYDSLVESGKMRRLVSEPAIQAAAVNPSSGTRGAVRGLILRRFGGHVTNMEWDSVTIALDGRHFEVKMDEVEGELIDRLDRIFTEASDMSAAIAAIEAGGKGR